MSIPLFRGGFLAACFFSSMAFAEARPDFSFSDQHIKNLGIELVTLAAQIPTTGTTFPAQLVLPPQQQLTLSAPANALVQQVLVQEHQVVKPNTPLLVITSPELGQLQLALLEASNRAHLASDEAERDALLFKEGIIARHRAEQSSAAEQNAAAALVQARAALQLAGLDKSAIGKIEVSGQVSSQITLTASTAGQVVDLVVKPGMRVAQSEPLLRVINKSSLWVDVQVPSQQAAQWPKGTVIHLSNGLEAKVLSISPVASSAQLVLLRGLVSGNTESLTPGEFVQAQLPASNLNAWELPLTAVSRHDNQAYVFVRAKDLFVATPVTVLSSAGQRIQISGALNSGSTVAISGVIALKAAWLNSALEGAAKEAK